MPFFGFTSSCILLISFFWFSLYVRDASCAVSLALGCRTVFFCSCICRTVLVAEKVINRKINLLTYFFSSKVDYWACLLGFFIQIRYFIIWLSLFFRFLRNKKNEGDVHSFLKGLHLFLKLFPTMYYHSEPYKSNLWPFWSQNLDNNR